MKMCGEASFLKWAAERGIGPGEGYPRTARPVFKPDAKLDRFWLVPEKPEARPYFLSLMLQLMGDWKSCFAWRPMGSWPAEPYPNHTSQVEFQILKGIGMPMGTADILEFDRGEIDPLLTLLFSTTVFGWSIGEDLSIIPDHAQFIMLVYHHGVVYVDFRNEGDLERFVNQMSKAEYPLPDRVPDGTFKRPNWMENRVE